MNSSTPNSASSAAICAVNVGWLMLSALGGGHEAAGAGDGVEGAELRVFIVFFYRFRSKNQFVRSARGCQHRGKSAEIAD